MVESEGVRAVSLKARTVKRIGWSDGNVQRLWENGKTKPHGRHSYIYMNRSIDKKHINARLGPLHPPQ